MSNLTLSASESLVFVDSTSISLPLDVLFTSESPVFVDTPSLVPSYVPQNSDSLSFVATPSLQLNVDVIVLDLISLVDTCGVKTPSYEIIVSDSLFFVDISLPFQSNILHILVLESLPFVDSSLLEEISITISEEVPPFPSSLGESLIYGSPFGLKLVRGGTLAGTYFGPGLPNDASPIVFPIVIDSTLIQESMMQILGTRQGERLLEPEFGSNIQDLLFEPDSNVMEQLLSNAIQGSLSQWEPRISIVSMDFNHEYAQNQIQVKIVYKISSLTQVQSLALVLTTP